MKRSKQWLHQANMLCEELSAEDGIDPRILMRKIDSKRKDYKAQQLCKVAKHCLSLVLTGELTDPLLQNLEVVDVATSEDRQILVVSVCNHDSGSSSDQDRIISKLQALQGHLRSVIAQSVNRKSTPALKFKFSGATEKRSRYAN